MNLPIPSDKPFEPERYELDEKPRFHFDLSRRAFVQILGAGLVVTASGGVSFAQRGSRRGSAPKTIVARLHLGEDGIVTVLTSKVEVGQGSRTQITQAVAEELRVPVERVRLIMADTDLCPNDGGTFGSLTTPRTVPAVRKTAAAARELLAEAASRSWGVDRSAVKAGGGAIGHAASRRRIAYAELAASDKLTEAYKEEMSGDIELTAVDEWKVLGTPVAKPTNRAIVTGTQKYPSDITRPGMLYGKVLRPPSYGATLLNVDLAPAQEMKGVVAVRDGQFVACAAPTSYQAAQAIEAISKTAQWETTTQPSSEDLSEYLREHAHTGEGGTRRPRARSKGDVDGALKDAHTTLRASYDVAYIQHVPMEPRAAMAEWKDGKLTVWTGSQRPSGVRGELSQAFGVPSDKVRVIIPDTGGGFGGKHTGEAAVEAARLARAAERPVAVHWTREEEFTWAYFRPAGVIDVAAGLDGKGSLVAWDFTNMNSGASALESPYAIPNARTTFQYSDSPLRGGSYRCLAATANTFARESFMDELAGEAGADPLAFRLNHLEHPRLRAVLEAAASAFGWKDAIRKTEKNVGVGLAVGTDKGGYVAACVEVAVGPRSRIEVRRLTQAFECGAIQNPANLRSQVEGCIVMGLGGALSEAMQFKDGKILNATLKEYEVPRFKDVPELDIHLLDRPDLPSAGAGESPIIAVAPAIGNALFRATGRRLRSLPLQAALSREA
ncbi:MAG: molybdopterin-dependent oxidoreductase [Candidatus Hydrogenedentes bacterium]|nr:molybdopterin-dependent oxidoreductase [Candidatus Hydrogenedentota bacterium]